MILALVVSFVSSALAFWSTPFLVPCWKAKDEKQGYALAVAYSAVVSLAFFVGIGSLVLRIPVLSLMPVFISTALLTFAIAVAVVLGAKRLPLFPGFADAGLRPVLMGCAVVAAIQTGLAFIMGMVL